MNMKKISALLLAGLLIISAVPITGMAAEEGFATRGEVVQMLLM
ncbi:MAG: hypothetical protein PUB42_01545 [Firmicutes bacterium]|nr:hypothetical protein [Bacillota bacterium]